MESSSRLDCSLDAEALAERRRFVRGEILSRTRRVEERGEGLRLHLPEDAGELLESFVELERSCCGFARFTIRPLDGGLVLDVDGPPGTREALARALGAAGLEEARARAD